METDLFWRIFFAFGEGVTVTVEVTIGALILALILGFMLARLRNLFPRRIVALCVAAYVETLRNVPSLTFLFLLYFGLAPLGIRLPSTAAAILGLGLIGAAVVTDVLRAGFQAVPKGQTEASAAIGLTPFQTFCLIILPQSLRLSVAPLGNYAVALVKDTSLVAAIAAPEVMFHARQIVNETFETALVYGCAAALYLSLTFTLSRGVHWVEKRTEY